MAEKGKLQKQGKQGKPKRDPERGILRAHLSTDPISAEQTSRRFDAAMKRGESPEGWTWGPTDERSDFPPRVPGMSDKAQSERDYAEITKPPLRRRDQPPVQGIEGNNFGIKPGTGRTTDDILRDLGAAVLEHAPELARNLVSPAATGGTLTKVARDTAFPRVRSVQTTSQNYAVGRMLRGA